MKKRKGNKIVMMREGERHIRPFGISYYHRVTRAGFLYLNFIFRTGSPQSLENKKPDTFGLMGGIGPGYPSDTPTEGVATGIHRCNRRDEGIIYPGNGRYYHVAKTYGSAIAGKRRLRGGDVPIAITVFQQEGFGKWLQGFYIYFLGGEKEMRLVPFYAFEGGLFNGPAQPNKMGKG